MAPRILEQRALERRAFRAHFREPGRDDDSVLDPRTAALFDHTGDRGRRRGDDGKLDRLRQVRDAAIAGDPAHRPVFGIDRVERALIRSLAQVLDEHAADGPVALAGADHRN